MSCGSCARPWPLTSRKLPPSPTHGSLRASPVTTSTLEHACWPTARSMSRGSQQPFHPPQYLTSYSPFPLYFTWGEKGGDLNRPNLQLFMLGVGRSALSTSFNHCSPASSARAHAHLFDGGLLPVTGQPDKKTDNTHKDTRRHGGTGATVYSKLPLLEGSDRERDTHRGGVDGASTPASTLVARGENEKPHNCAR